ncbi:MAG TPA: hypothetical protein VF856_03310 [Gemmatimonadaceae bacterium]
MLDFYAVLGRIRDANVVALRNIGNAPTRVGVVPGAIAWDDCDQCGLLALASARNFLSDQFPIELTVTTADQGAVLCADMVVQIVRCAPEPQGGETAPSVAALEASAREVIADATAVMCATIDVLNALSTSGDIYDFMMRGQMFVGPAGACVGSELQFVVGVIR